MLPRVVFTLVIAKIFSAGVVFNIEVTNSYLVGDPKESHLHRARSLSLDRVVGDSCCSCVITMYRGGGLLMAQFRQN